MEKKYNPKTIEQFLYDHWERQGYFKINVNQQDLNNHSYCIMIPPPNITGYLHMGHAFQQTLMDTLIRYHRMQGKQTLWQMGTDHAGIATQIVVERLMYTEEKKNRIDCDRDIFIKNIWKWKEKIGNVIQNQMRRLGNSLDWERERFTLDDGFSEAVKEAFVRLYEDNLIYRGKRLVNWDPKLRTAISDLEVVYREVNGWIWYLRYPLSEKDRTNTDIDYLLIATTRPETIFGDTAVAVHPSDLRYRHLIGKHVIVPLINRIIPIIGDEYTNTKKETGCVKITPAHDFNDYIVGKRHELPMINIFTNDAHLRQESEVFNTYGEISNKFTNNIPENIRGLERFAARKMIISQCKQLGLLESVKSHTFIAPYSDRGDVIIEPMLTNQWFLHTIPLANLAVKAVEQGKIKFVSKQYEKMYFYWMKNIQDWCISRQLWWGHRIPAWYDNNGTVYVGKNEKEVRLKHQLNYDVSLRQEEDVLDTWFSSGLWTFSTLGWPEDTEMLRTFHPTQVIVSAFDIIFFWIARMIMLTMYFIKDKNGDPQVPFKHVYITGLIRDEKGQKMSKSKGNIIDPLDVIDGISLEDLVKKRTNNMIQPKLSEQISRQTKKSFPKGIKAYGTDTLRLALSSLASGTREINWDMGRLDKYYLFCNKLWNASRFVLIYTENMDCGFNGGDKILSLSDRWILATFNNITKDFRDALDNYRFDLSVSILYDFTWHQFCDWYVEISKSILVGEKGEKTLLRGTRHTLVTVLDKLLRLAHPLIPFITETIWQRLHKIKLLQRENTTIMLQSFPKYEKKYEDIMAIKDFEWIKKMIIAIRTIRSERNIDPRKSITILLRGTSDEVEKIVCSNFNFILTLGRLQHIHILRIGEQAPISVTKMIDDTELLIPINNMIATKEDEVKRLEKALFILNNKIEYSSNKLSKEQFTQKAPEEIVIQEREKLSRYQKEKEQLLQHKQMLSDL